MFEFLKNKKKNKELERRLKNMEESGRIAGRQREQYEEILRGYQEQMKNFNNSFSVTASVYAV